MSSYKTEFPVNNSTFETEYESVTIVDNGGTDPEDLIPIYDELNSLNERYSQMESDVSGIQQQINEEAHFRGYLSTDVKVQSLEATPNDFAYSAESGTKWVFDAEYGWVDTGTPVPDQLTPASDSTPLMNGVASVGSSETYARGDHRHPTDTTRVSVTDFNEFKTETNEVLKDVVDQSTLDGQVDTAKIEMEQYVDEKIGDIESALDELHNYAEALKGGA